MEVAPMVQESTPLREEIQNLEWVGLIAIEYDKVDDIRMGLKLQMFSAWANYLKLYIVQCLFQLLLE